MVKKQKKARAYLYYRQYEEVIKKRDWPLRSIPLHGEERRSTMNFGTI